MAATMTDEQVRDYAEQIIWSVIPATVNAVLLTSPTSDRQYRITTAGSCSCPAGLSRRLCKHVRALELEFGGVEAGIAFLVQSELPAALAAMPAQEAETVQPKRSRISPKTFAADWEV